MITNTYKKKSTLILTRTRYNFSIFVTNLKCKIKCEDIWCSGGDADFCLKKIWYLLMVSYGDFPPQDLQVLFARLYTFHFQTFAGHDHVTVPLNV